MNWSLLKNILRRYSLFLVTGLLILLAVEYYFYWHLRPFTQNAFVFANTRAVTPLVAGYIDGIFVENNQFVRKGEPLFHTYSVPYESKVRQLEASIAEQEATIRQIQAQIASGKASARQLEANVLNAKYLSDQGNVMVKTETVSQKYAEEQNRAYQSAVAAKESADYSVQAREHQLDAARNQLKNLQEQLILAKIYLEQTTVRALSDGYVVNMTITPGGYYEPGNVLFAFLDTSEWFVQANFEESELSQVQPGTQVRIWLRQYPGHEFSGTVGNPGYGAERRSSASGTGMPVVAQENEWFLLPQRFPVQIRITDPPDDPVLHFGGSAYVELETESHPIRQFFWELFLK